MDNLELNGIVRIVARVTNLFTYHFEKDNREERNWIIQRNIAKVKMFERNYGIPSYVTQYGFALFLSKENVGNEGVFWLPHELLSKEKFDLCIAFKNDHRDENFHYVTSQSGDRFYHGDYYRLFNGNAEILPYEYFICDENTIVSRIKSGKIEIFEFKIIKDKRNNLKIKQFNPISFNIKHLITENHQHYKGQNFANIAYGANKAEKAYIGFIDLMAKTKLPVSL